ncbi:hypothetical protein DUNSADRAFT_12065 [Dunaliella salina]|uniref:Encoded protein n=1 Tax=Dunaliella salina TaxID=3046 RepID=A0ABQ7H423_DUNSA|nr:hypothetical protein DUNSADRAFT_12065 [Dunaliella salina]|eukprot:KAF5841609.1 hypothetical protein DUNSADRAFT_12065 [Dunaliella salina]
MRNNMEPPQMRRRGKKLQARMLMTKRRTRAGDPQVFSGCAGKLQKQKRTFGAEFIGGQALGAKAPASILGVSCAQGSMVSTSQSQVSSNLKVGNNFFCLCSTSAPAIAGRRNFWTAGLACLAYLPA